MNRVSTFSIVARDPETGDLGVATASRFLAVGAVVPYAAAGVAAIATQSYANTSYGPRTIAGLRAGIALPLIHRAFEESDEHHAERQYGMVDASGNSLSFTGKACHPWAGGREGPGYAAQGNLLTGPEVVDELVAAFLASEGPLAERLLAALSAGDEAGGDRRGRQSAALLVVREGGGYGGLDDRYIDLRVDDAGDPVPELRRLLSLQRLYFERPLAANRVVIDDGVAERLQRILVRAGWLQGKPGAWGEAAEAALREMAGVENLEEHMLEHGLVDKVVLEHLERKYG